LTHLAASAELKTLLTPSLAVALLALAFTVGSFWWIQVRRGRLLAFPPRSYAGAYLTNSVRVVFPLVLYNTGPTPIVVTDFRMRLGAPGGDDQARQPMLPVDMSWQAIQPRLEPAPPGGERVLPSPFPVAGRQAVERFVEFARAVPVELPTADGPYEVTVEVLLAHHRTWRTLTRFLLHTELVTSDDARGYIVRTNDPDWMP
jgi:hypothetical protein